MTTTIELGGRKWEVAELSARRCIEFTVLVASFGTMNPARMTREDLERLYGALLIGLQQKDPTLTIDALMDLPISPFKAIEAVITIAPLAGMEIGKVPSPVAGSENPLTPQNSGQAGTPSSPTS